jgi:hypothetical protein
MTHESRLLALALSTVASALASAHAFAATPPEIFAPGYYSIRVNPLFYPVDPAAGQCLIQGNNGFGGPVRYLWGDSADLEPCGMASMNAFMDNGQALYALEDAGFDGPAGERAYVLVNKRSGQCLQFERNTRRVVFSPTGCDPSNANLSALWWLTGTGDVTRSPIKPFLSPGQCMIFGNNGRDHAPSVHRWDESPSDQHWCGRGSKEALEDTGQGLFLLERRTN